MEEQQWQQIRGRGGGQRRRRSSPTEYKQIRSYRGRCRSPRIGDAADFKDEIAAESADPLNQDESEQEVEDEKSILSGDDGELGNDD